MGRLMGTLIEVRGLRKSFGPRAALAGVDLSVAAGEFTTLVGPNGAGKTTLLRILATLARPSSGSVKVAGLDLARAGIEVRRHVGFLSHRTLLYDDLTAEQNMAFYARMYDLEDGPARIGELLKRVGLAARRHDLVRTFSRGMQQRLAVARAVLHRPQLLLLDEPYTGLDPVAGQVLTALLAELAGDGCTILLTTHDLARGLEVGQRLVVLAHGDIVYDVPRTHLDLGSFPEEYVRLTR
jgi:heme exporter protein A